MNVANDESVRLLEAKAATNVDQMLNDQRMFLTTTRLLIKYHPNPQDYWRGPDEGLKLLLDDAGLEDVQTHSLGNRDCARESMDGSPDFDPSCHFLENDLELPPYCMGVRTSFKRDRRSGKVTPRRADRHSAE
jgi:hypothetical protein